MVEKKLDFDRSHEKLSDKETFDIHTSCKLKNPNDEHIPYSMLFRVVKTTLSSSYNISGLVAACWLLFQCF